MPKNILRRLPLFSCQWAVRLKIRVRQLRLIPVSLQGLHNPLLMLRPEGFHGDLQLHRRVPVHADELVVIQLNDISLLVRDN